MASSTVRNQVSSLARELRPYWQQDVDRTLARRGNGGGRTGGAGGGAMAIHDLDGAFHTGTLTDAQGPQFALLDGSRTYTGNITFSGGQTVDDVDISAHVADPDAHHYRVTDGGGLIVSGGNTQIVSVNQAYDFSWTGLHDFADTATFHADPQIDANLNFIGGPRSITSSGTNHLTLDPGGDLILPADDTFRSSDYADGIPITGFSLFADPSGDRQLTIFGIKVDEMHARAFVADMVRVDIGEEWWGKSLGLLYDDFTTPSTIGGTATMVLEDAPAIAGQLFSENDWVMLRVIDLPAAGTTGTATIAYVWGQVSAYVDLVADDNGIGRQQWTFTLRDGPFSTLIKKGSVVVCFGVTGQGYIHLSALDSAQGPWIQIGDWNGADPYTAGNRTPRTQIGRLDSLSDPDMTPAGWGLYSDNAYLRGMLRTVETMMDDDGLSFLHPSQPTVEFGDYAYLAWWPDINARTGLPTAYLTSHTITSAPITDYFQLIQYQQASSAAANLMLMSYDSIESFSSIELMSNQTIRVAAESGMTLQGSFLPESDLTYDLGTASLRWRNLYVNQLFVSGSIAGDTLSGAEWEYAGSMIIDANSASATTVQIVNQGTGSASLSVEGNITLGGTVDGVDISAHNSNPSAHHALATAGDGVTVSGAQVVAVNSTVVRTTRLLTAGDGLDGGGDLSANRSFAVDSSVVRTSRVITAGSGMTGGGALSANITLNVIGGDGITANADDIAVDSTVVRTSRQVIAGAGMTGGGALAADITLNVVGGDGIAVAADEILVDLATHSGLQFATGNLQMGTPTIVTVNTTNSVTSATHAHAIDHSSDPGTVSKILSSTSAGGLTLRYLAVDGNVDIRNNGDLDVSNHTLFVDATKNSVGIGGIPLSNPDFPDAQFALDINGPARASYWIGPHAIQLKDVLLLSHFDGKEPYNTNETGEPNSAMGQVGVPSTVSGVPNLVFRPGKFFKALEITRAATNLVGNPQFDSASTSGWVDYVTGTATGSRTAINTRETYIGEYSYRLLKNGGGASDKWGAYCVVAVTSGLTYTFSVWVYTSAMVGGNRRIRLQAELSVPTTSVTYDTPDSGSSGGWIRLNVTATATATGNARLMVFHDDVTTGIIDLSAVQVTQSAFAHPYTQTTRSATSLNYPSVPANWNRLTLMAWIYPAAAASEVTSGLRIATLYKNASNYYQLVVATSNLLRLTNAGGVVVESTTAIAGNAWTHVTLTVGAGIANLYINGVAEGSATLASVPVGTLPTLYVGTTETSNNWLNGLIDDLVLVDRTLEAAEILSVYESNAPVFAESVRYSARFTQKGLGWFDDEGLWMNDTLGNAVMGFYGGEAASKSWAGTTLAPGDILFGRTGSGEGGWFRFDRDGSGSTGIVQLGYGLASNPVFSITNSAAKLQGINLELFNGASAFLGVFATAPAGGTWAGLAGVAAGDVVIGDTARGAIVYWNDDLSNLNIGVNSTVATGPNISIGAGSISLRFGSQNRLRLVSAGHLYIMNSDGAAVFTFNSTAGAEFSLPLTLGTNGGIYQGTGTFATAATTGIGLKIFRDSVTGIGKLSTYNTGVEQVTLDTDGKFKAGAGIVTLDAQGITVTRHTSAANPINAYAFGSGATIPAAIYNYATTGLNNLLIQTNDTTVGNALTINNNTPAANAGTLHIVQTVIAGGQENELLFSTNGSGTRSAKLGSLGAVYVDSALTQFGVHTASPTAAIDINGNTIRLRTARTIATATTSGSVGEICWNGTHLFICTALNTWRRVSLSAW